MYSCSIRGWLSAHVARHDRMVSLVERTAAGVEAVQGRSWQGEIVAPIDQH
jgi:hypothetical protein